MNEDMVKRVAQDLENTEPFADRDWRYTRDLGDIYAIRDRHTDREHSLKNRIKGAWRWLFRDSPIRSIIPVRRLDIVRHILFGKKDSNAPDGMVNRGNILTFWEEQGQYIAQMNPTVGDIIAEWLKAEPTNPYAQRVAEAIYEVQRDMWGDDRDDISD